MNKMCMDYLIVWKQYISFSPLVGKLEGGTKIRKNVIQYHINIFLLYYNHIKLFEIESSPSLVLDISIKIYLKY